ncbi:hypothetical protein GCM10009838_55830 [Catenulispora subtropica]|uniref:DNA topoisomerase I catalytic core eukaryotic-type domain-containing protein n=1 Tax=Catenulispora subtropica TaxID=450798 RepID=A0ABP5DUX5_9ACTN
MIVIDMINAYDREDADLLVPSVRGVVPVLHKLLERAHIVLSGQVTEQCVLYSALDAQDLAGEESTAKDFRTWHATVLAAVGLAVSEPVSPAATARRRAVSRAVTEAAEYLGNTPAVCRASYIDHRVIDRYLNGETVPLRLGELGRATPQGNPATHGHAERAVLRMLRDSD